jgi:hypothetical protein
MINPSSYVAARFGLLTAGVILRPKMGEGKTGGQEKAPTVSSG